MAVRPRHVRHRFRTTLLAFVASLTIPPAVCAQTMLAGIVYDPNGQLATDVPVIVEREGTNRRWTTVSSSIGEYRFETLPPGRYRVIVDVTLSPTSENLDTPLKPVNFSYEGLEVRRGYKTALDINLELLVDETVTVSSPAALPVPEPLPPKVDTISVTFAGDAFDEPLTNGRTVQSKLLLVPGIVVTESVGTLAQFTAAGQRRFSNRLTIDGVSADLGVDVLGPGIGQAATGTLPAFATSGGTQTLVPAAAIEEIEVRTTSTSPEHARSPGAQMIVVTRAGGDRPAGSAFYDSRPNGLAARDWFANAGHRPQRKVTYWNAGASMGGPLYRKKLFYFASFERQQFSRDVHTTTPVPSTSVRESASPAARAILDAFPQPNSDELDEGLAEFSHTFPARSKLSVFSFRADGNLSPRHQVFARVNVGNSSGDSLNAFDSLPSLPYSTIESTATRTATAGVLSVFPTAMHDLRVNVTTHRGSAIADTAPYGGAKPLPMDLFVIPDRSLADASVTAVIFNGAGGLLAAGSLSVNTQRQMQVVDTWTVQRGRHEWRFGFDYRHLTVATKAAPDRYTYRFSSIDDLLDGRVRQVSLDHVDPAGARFDSWSLFAQDAFRISGRLSLNYGLRYSIRPAPSSTTELQPLLVKFDTLPNAQARSAGESLWRTSWSNVAPYVTSTYQVSTSTGREMNIRAGWNLLFDDVITRGMAAFGGGYPYVSSGTLLRTTFPVAPGSLNVSLPAPFTEDYLAEYYSFSSDMRLPRTHEWHVGIEQALGRSQRVGASYAGSAGRGLVYWEGYYLDPPLSQRVNAFSNAARSDYHALLVEYVRLLSQRLQARVAYAWSHAIDTDSGESSGPHLPLPYAPAVSERASSDFDRRHVLHTIGSYQFPAFRLPKVLRSVCSDWQVDVAATVITGSPVSVALTRALDYGFYEVRPDRVPGVPVWLVDPSSPTGRRLNTDAFKIPDESRQGTLGRNSIRGSILRQVDVAFARSFSFGRHVNAQFRIEAFNVFNTPNFGSPDPRLLVNDSFGRPLASYADSLGRGTLVGGGLIPIQQIGGQRSVQLGIRVAFN